MESYSYWLQDDLVVLRFNGYSTCTAHYSSSVNTNANATIVS